MSPLKRRRRCLDRLAVGKIAPFIGQRYDLSEVPTALRHLEQLPVMGKQLLVLHSHGRFAGVNPCLLCP